MKGIFEDGAFRCSFKCLGKHVKPLNSNKFPYLKQEFAYIQYQLRHHLLDYST